MNKKISYSVFIFIATTSSLSLRKYTFSFFMKTTISLKSSLLKVLCLLSRSFISSVMTFTIRRLSSDSWW